MNTLLRSYKIYNFVVTLSLTAAMLSAVRDICHRPLPAVRLIESVVHNFHRKVFNVRFFSFC